MPDENNQEVMLKVEPKHEYGFFKVIGRVCFWEDSKHKVLWPEHQSEFDGLMVNSTSSRNMPSSPSYGWDIEYRDIYYVDLHRAEPMVRVLRRASKAMDRLNDQFGYATTFGAYVLRAAKGPQRQAVHPAISPRARRGEDGGGHHRASRYRPVDCRLPRRTRRRQPCLIVPGDKPCPASNRSARP